MIYPIKFSRYKIDLVSPPNAQSNSGEITGAVLEVNGGYGCIQVWPELGDMSLDCHLIALRDGNPTPLGKACLNCCQIDGAARKARVNLFNGLVVPRSHYLITGENSGDVFERHLEMARPYGVVKIKGSPDLQSTLVAVERASKICRVRIDFNSSLDASSFELFSNALSKTAREQIEFIEDPIPYDQIQWQRISEEGRFMLALDWGGNEADGGFAVRIWKPARQLHPPPGKKYCITHNMDHVIGRRYASYQASIFKGNLLSCGLDDTLPLNGDTGLGLDSELSAMEWEILS
jgi:O-succinylbenzoate synthase